MRNVSRALLAGLVLLIAPATSRADLPEIKARGTLRVIYVSPNTVASAASRFFVVSNGVATGFDAEVLERFCKVHALRMTTIACPAHQVAFSALLTDKGDLLAGNLTATENRRKIVDFTVEVLPTRYVIITRKPHRVIQTLDEFREEKVGSTRGTSRHEATLAVGVPAANLDDTIPTDALPTALRNGKVTAAIMEIFGAVTAQRDDPAIQLGMFVGTKQSLAYAVRKDEPLLLKALNDNITSARSSPLWQQLLGKYLGTVATEMLEKTKEP